MDDYSSALNMSAENYVMPSWNDFYNQYQNGLNTSIRVKDTGGYDIVSKFLNGLDGRTDIAKDEYDRLLQLLDKQFELDKMNNSRAWEEMMDSTKYQRMAADLKAAGINPALVFANGIGATGQPASPSGSLSTHYKHNAQSKSANGSQWLASAAMMLLAIARIAAL